MADLHTIQTDIIIYIYQYQYLKINMKSVWNHRIHSLKRIFRLLKRNKGIPRHSTCFGIDQKMFSTNKVVLFLVHFFYFFCALLRYNKPLLSLYKHYMGIYKKSWSQVFNCAALLLCVHYVLYITQCIKIHTTYWNGIFLYVNSQK